MRRRLTLALVAAVLAAGCRTPEEKLLDRRRDLRAALDQLYGEYGGSDLARDMGGAPEGEPSVERRREGGDRAQAPAGGGGGVVGRFVQELDRSHFEESCLAVGRGERPFLLSERLEAFLSDADHSRACRDAARIQSDVSALEREVQARR